MRRSEEEMMGLILQTAREDARIRAVQMNGSRVSGEENDEWQDYDIVYYVDSIFPFVLNMDWIARFGERVMLEMPIYKDGGTIDGIFNYQMLFKDGNRLDLILAEARMADALIAGDPVGRVLLDKDGLLDAKPYLDASAYHVSCPEEFAFENCCNSFLWMMQNVAKGILRKELPYAMQMLDITRESLIKMLSWRIGLEKDFKVSIGKMGRKLEKYMLFEEWLLYKKTYPKVEYACIWRALHAMHELFFASATAVCRALGYNYPEEEDRNMLAYMRTYWKEMPG